MALVKVTDIPTGAYTFRSLVINTAPSTGTLTLIPDTISLTGVDDTICGSGNADVLVFDGIRPYSIICPDPRVQVANSTTSSTEPGRFTINVGASTAGNCLTNVQCVISDNTGARALLSITTAVGPKAPTPPAITVTPSAVTLACGQSSAVTITGGTGTFTVNSTTPVVTGVISGATLSITRAATDPAGGPFTMPTTLTITDGASVATVAVTAPTTCP